MQTYRNCSVASTNVYFSLVMHPEKKKPAMDNIKEKKNSTKESQIMH